MPFSSDATVVRKRGLLDAEIDSEVVALDIDSGVCFGLNRVGSRIWSLIKEPIRIDAIYKKLLAEFDIDEARCEREMFEFLEELHKETLIEIVSHE